MHEAGCTARASECAEAADVSRLADAMAERYVALSADASGRIRPQECVSDEKRLQAYELFEHGIGYTKAAWILGLPVNTARDWSRKHKRGLFRATLPKNQYRYSSEVRARAIALRLAGRSWREIRALTGVSQNTVRKWLAKEAERNEAEEGSRESRAPQGRGA